MPGWNVTWSDFSAMAILLAGIACHIVLKMRKAATNSIRPWVKRPAEHLTND